MAYMAQPNNTDEMWSNLCDELDIKSSNNINDLNDALTEIWDIMDAHKYLRSNGQYDGMPLKNIHKAAYEDRRRYSDDNESSNTPYDSFHYNRVKTYYQPKIKLLDEKINLLRNTNK